MNRRHVRTVPRNIPGSPTPEALSRDRRPLTDGEACVDVAEKEAMPASDSSSPFIVDVASIAESSGPSDVQKVFINEQLSQAQYMGHHVEKKRGGLMKKD